MLLVGGAASYWLYGDRLPSVLGRAARGAADRVTDVAARGSERLDSPEGERIAKEEAARREAARRAQDAALGWVAVNTDALAPEASATVRALQQPAGPAYLSLSSAQIAGLLTPLLRQMPPSAHTVQVALNRDLLLLRADVALRDVAGDGAFGSVVGAAIDGHDTLFLAGVLEPVHAGLAQYRVREMRLTGIDVPTRVIPSLIGALRRRARYRVPQSDSLAADALPVPLPRSVSDARVVNGALTLYRAAASAGATSRTTP